MGFAFVVPANVCSRLIVDRHLESPSTATVVIDPCRCLLGAAATSVIKDMINASGRTRCSTSSGLTMMVSWGTSKLRTPGSCAAAQLYTTVLNQFIQR
jgi:hypothetical protein